MPIGPYTNTDAGTVLEDVLEISSRGSHGLAMFILDQTTQPLDVWMTNKKGVVTTTTVATQGGNTVDLEPGHGAVIGDVIESSTADNFVQALIVNVVGDTITVNTPWSRTFPIGTTIGLGSPKMDVVASPGSPVIFSLKPSSAQKVDVTRLIISVQDNLGMDFTTFGGIAALSTGCVLRQKQSDGNFINMFNWRSNGELIERSFDHSFQEKQGGGDFGFVARSTWAGQDKRGVAIRVDGSLNEELQIVIQDDLSALTKFNIVVQGHLLQN